MSHYYITDKTLTNEQKTIEYTYGGYRLRFITNRGVFSKDRVDYGTNVLLNHLILRGEHILDIGCGYGIVGIAIAKANPKRKIIMADINETAIELAKENIFFNQVPNIEALVSDLYQNILKTFDMILSNPPIRAGKVVVHNIIKEGYLKLNDLGEMWVVIQKKQGAESLMKKMLEVYGNCELVAKANGYWVMKSIKNRK